MVEKFKVLGNNNKYYFQFKDNKCRESCYELFTNYALRTQRLKEKR